MKMLTISGPKDDIDRMVDVYLSKYQIHLENALTELYGAKTLRPYVSSSPFKEYLERINILIDYIGPDALEDVQNVEENNATLETIQHLIKQLEKDTNPYHQKVVQYQTVKDKKQESLDLVKPFENLDYPLEKILKMDSIRFRFGRFTNDNYLKFKKYVYDMTASIFIECTQDEKYTYGVYFTPITSLQRVDAMYVSMNWERIFIPDDFTGTPKENKEKLMQEINTLEKHITDNQEIINKILRPYRFPIIRVKNRLEKLNNHFNIRKYAALTHDENVQKETRYLLRGWMPSREAKQFAKETDPDPNVIVIVENDEDEKEVIPPTKINNIGIFRPYEMFIKMYGVPNYKEFDPTWLIASTYSLLFGAMFGDVGQGLILALVGFTLYKQKQMDLGGIIGLAGMFSALFGVLYGSVFGFEEIIPALWLHPLTAMSTLPFLGSINTIFVVAILFGVFLIFTTLFFNIYNKVHEKETGEAIFDRNGLAGLLFYTSMIGIIGLYMLNQPLPATFLLLIMFGVPLLLIAFEQPILARIEHIPRQDGGKGTLLVQAFFEIFEVVLSYVSNTISFVRVGAFAVSHGAMMQVVMMLAGATDGGSINWLVVILGNIFVTLLEGLVVGIQVLRLEFYEIFSHFYKGDGRQFINHINKN